VVDSECRGWSAEFPDLVLVLRLAKEGILKRYLIVSHFASCCPWKPKSKIRAVRRYSSHREIAMYAKHSSNSICMFRAISLSIFLFESFIVAAEFAGGSANAQQSQ